MDRILRRNTKRLTTEFTLTEIISVSQTSVYKTSLKKRKRELK